MNVLNTLRALRLVGIRPRVGTVEPVSGAILNEYVVMLKDGDLVNDLNNRTANGLKTSEADNLLVWTRRTRILTVAMLTCTF
jgi:hypothetical protein